MNFLEALDRGLQFEGPATEVGRYPLCVQTLSSKWPLERDIERPCPMQYQYQSHSQAMLAVSMESEQISEQKDTRSRITGKDIKKMSPDYSSEDFQASV